MDIANGDVPMTEQMTGRKGPAGTERPGGAATGPSAPSPRDLAARSPHPAARDGQPRPSEAPPSAPPQVAAAVPAQHLPAQGPAEPPRVQVTSPGKVRA